MFSLYSSDRDDFDINSIEDSDDNHYIGDVATQDFNTSVKTATRKKETQTGSKMTSNRKTSTPSKPSISLPNEGKKSSPKRSKLKKSSSSFSSVSDVFGKNLHYSKYFPVKN